MANKGIREFVDAAEKLKAKIGDKVDFRIAGSLDANPNGIKQQEVDSWREQGVTYCGQVSDMLTYLNESSVFVLPSYYMEGTPRSILEAMAVGRAIITTDNRGCRDTVDEGRNGYLVPKRDSQKLYERMQDLVESPSKVVEFGKGSREIVVEKYDVKLVCNEMLKAMNL